MPRPKSKKLQESVIERGEQSGKKLVFQGFEQTLGDLDMMEDLVAPEDYPPAQARAVVQRDGIQWIPDYDLQAGQRGYDLEIVEGLTAERRFNLKLRGQLKKAW